MKKEVKKGEKCVLYDRDCIGCGECEFCDLDPLKICDNCGKCLQMDDYASFKIDSIDGVALRKDDCDCGHEDCCDDDCGCGHDDCCDDDCGCGHDHKSDGSHIRIASKNLHGHKN